ncbi:MAG: hypothetical protein FWD52_04535 [Candidatus Bathyarchaeota archaeon]|nr:hypothetical protein [Candidatus Termiticorpusculum sp.]
MQATITLEYSDTKTAEVVTKAVSPDNLKAPFEVKIHTVNDGCRVVTDIVCEGKLATFTATIDDLLFSASTAEKTLQTIKQSK